MYIPGLWAAAIVFVVVLAAACGASESTGLDEELLAQGQELYERDCQVCHGDVRTGKGATDNAPVHGPAGHTWHHADQQLRQMILGTLDYPGKTMPAFPDLADDEVDALLEYMKSGWDGEQRAWQAGLSRNWIEPDMPAEHDVTGQESP